MSDDNLKILPGQVTQLTHDPPATGVLRYARQDVLRRVRGEPPAWKTTVSKAGGTAKTVLDVPPWPEPSGPCCVCGERPATEVVYGCPGAMTMQCRRCILRAMVASAREAAARLPELERELVVEEARP